MMMMVTVSKSHTGVSSVRGNFRIPHFTCSMISIWRPVRRDHPDLGVFTDELAAAAVLPA
eukprot:761373-Hanusia_phi.AAC.1